MNVAYINPFMKACQDIVKEVLNLDFTRGNMYVKQGMHDIGDVLISIGVLGNVKGNFYLNFPRETALSIASIMMSGYPVTELDEITTSAISELSNMIAGHAGMNFANENITIDITPPDITVNSESSRRNYLVQAICVPLTLSNKGTIELDIALY